ncbi:MAG: Kdo domain containing protein [Flavobacteriaceae bacterium]|nr:Kdo domain containing protein [Flavobacteriaceae bacterium]
MKIIFAETGKRKKEAILNCIENFNSEGESLNDGQRNSIKIFDLEAEKINIKSFKIPNAVNKIVYRFFRKSKAERSFQYANHLISNNIGTPFPIAFAENKSGLTFKDSYFVSEHLDCDLTFRELVTNPDYPNHEEILRAFTRFTFNLHEQEIEFLDHSPGNTLIQLNNGDYKFFLVDLNRMNFKKLNFEERMKNFARLTPKKEMIEVMANEYAHLINKPEAEVFEKMWFFTNQFQEKFQRKKELKKKLRFWKS